METVATDQYISAYELPQVAIEDIKIQASAMVKEMIASTGAPEYIKDMKAGDDTKKWNAYTAYLLSEYGTLTQKNACEICDVTPQHYRNLKAENIDEWDEIAKFSYDTLYNDVFDKLMAVHTLTMKIETNVLIALGIVNKDHSGDSRSKMVKFLDAGKAAGYNWENRIEVHEFVDFYTKLTTSERVELGCKV